MTRDRSLALLLPLLACLGLALPTPARAEDLAYRFKSAVLTGQGAPEISFQTARAVTRLTFAFRGDDGSRFDKSFKGLISGAERTIKLPARKGTVTYRVHVYGDFKDGGSVDHNFDLPVSVLDALDVRLRKEDVDLGAGRIGFALNRPAASAELIVYGKGGDIVTREEVALDGRTQGLEVRFPTDQGELGDLVLRVTDEHGYWAEQTILHCAYDIPHDEVEFDFGKWDIRPSEEPKLKAALGRVRQAMETCGKLVDVNLYVAGYTDSVGSRADNLTLSEQRATAIGRWFRAHGIDTPVYVQGFGEDVLFKATPDETAEAANRRAVYVVGNHHPATSTAIPRAAWKRLP